MNGLMFYCEVGRAIEEYVMTVYHQSVCCRSLMIR